MNIVNEKPTVSFTSNGILANCLFGGKNWFWPDQFTPEGKRRGGMPICWPFSDCAKELDDSLPKHGLLRVIEDFDCSKENSNTFIFSKIIEMPISGNTQKIYFVYRYSLISLVQGGIELTITALNKEGTSTMIPSNMGLHPYFSTPKKGDVVVTNFKGPEFKLSIGDTIGSSSYHPFPVSNREHVRYIDIKIPGQGIVRMGTKGFNGIVVWRDSLDYICIEPVEVTKDDFGTPRGSYLEKGKSLEFYCSLDFFPEE